MNEQNQIPYAPMAEKAVLSIMMRDVSRIAQAAAEGIGVDMFHVPAHRMILELFIEARDKGEIVAGMIEHGVFLQKASLAGILEKIGGPAMIAELMTYEPTASGWSAWLGQLREAKARRIALESSEMLLNAADSGEAIQMAREALERLERAITAKTRAIRASMACDEFITDYLALFENDKTIPGQSTGILEIDAVTGGMKPGELWTVGGPSSSGKSALMYQIANYALQESKTVAVFSAELMAREIIGRMLCLSANVPYAAITNPKQEAKKHEIEKIQRTLAEMKQSKLWIDATSNQSLDSITSEAGRIRDIAGKVDLVVVDYLQIVKGRRNKGDSREQEIASLSGGLKQLAKDMACPVITGTQLNDDGKTRESRAIEQDSDILILIDGNQLVMRKNRNGERNGTVNVALDGARQRFCRYTTE